MPLTTTPGSASADSYVSVAGADQYHSDLGSGSWTGGQAEKEAALRRATRWIDGKYRHCFPGTRANGRGQPLEWPRSGAVDGLGDAIPDNEIPIEIVWATCEAASREIVEPGSLSPDFTPAETVKREKVGPLEVEYAVGQGSVEAADQVPTLSRVEHALSGLISRPLPSYAFVAGTTPPR